MLGFGDKTELKPGIPEDALTLKYASWDNFSLGNDVVSGLTGTSGVISEIDQPFRMVGITWNNGKASFDSKDNMENVILL